MNDITAWVELTRAKNYIVRCSDGTRDPVTKRLKKFHKYHIDKNQTMTIDGEQKTGKWLAEALAKRVERDYYAHRLGIQISNESLMDLLQIFLDEKSQENRSWQTLGSLKRALSAMLKEIPSLDEFTTDNIRNYKVKLKNAGYSHNTIHLHMNIVAQFANWLVLKEKILKSPIQKGIVGAPLEPTPKYFSTDEFLALDQYLAESNPLARIAIRLMRDYGLRLIEVVGDDIDRQEGVLWEDLIWRSDGKVDLVIRKEVTKGKKRGRKLRLSQSFVEILGSRRSGPLVPINRRSLEGLFVRAMEKAGIKNPGKKIKNGFRHKLTPHSLRHTFGKDFLQRTGRTQVELRDLMGHKDVRTTEIYSQFEETHLDEAMERLNDARRKEDILLGTRGNRKVSQVHAG